jgi:hypothetical protein
MDLSCSSDRNLNPNNYKIMDFLNFKHSFNEKKIILQFPIVWTPYAIRVVRSLEVYKFINDSSEHFLIFLNYKEILNKISLHDLNQIKPLIVDFFF